MQKELEAVLEIGPQSKMMQVWVPEEPFVATGLEFAGNVDGVVIKSLRIDREEQFLDESIPAIAMDGEYLHLKLVRHQIDILIENTTDTKRRVVLRVMRSSQVL